MHIGFSSLPRKCEISIKLLLFVDTTLFVAGHVCVGRIFIAGCLAIYVSKTIFRPIKSLFNYFRLEG